MDRLSMGHELLGRKQAFAAWETLTRSPAFIGALVEADRPVAGSRIVGFGCTAFVTDDFALRELADPRPGLNARILAGVSKGPAVTLTRDQIARGNRSSGLFAVILMSVLRDGDLRETEIDEALSTLLAAALHCHTGFRLRMLLREAVGAANIQHVLWQKVFRLASNYEEFHRRNPGSDWSQERMLFNLDAASARAVAGTFYHSIFQCREPVLELRKVEQDLLTAALGGLTDDELVRTLDLKMSTVKKRWVSILNRVSLRGPEILPDDSHSGDSRGRQRRHHLLAYLRQHPEELRPWARPKSSRHRRVTTMPLRNLA